VKIFLKNLELKKVPFRVLLKKNHSKSRNLQFQFLEKNLELKITLKFQLFQNPKNMKELTILLKVI
jgi:hypothetical protein